MQEKTMRVNKQALQVHLAYRQPMKVTELHIRRRGDGFYMCPRCGSTLEREFVRYCDRCGQCLNWSQYRKAKRVYL